MRINGKALQNINIYTPTPTYSTALMHTYTRTPKVINTQPQSHSHVYN